ncbi:TfoX/Sxy family DNA transformation protein [Eisenbergiella porci]|uniref:TfoX/Sxy family DNA transformation protein n=1 Tax=Eisenbergiella porci TaxID=2652274 RepID=UPI002FE6E873
MKTQVWLKIQSIDASACIHRLSALESAVEGVRKTELTPEIKSRPEGLLSGAQAVMPAARTVPKAAVSITFHDHNAVFCIIMCL